GEPPGLDLVARDHTEILQNPLEQVFFGQERVQHQRRERRPIDLLEQGAAERRLAGADVAGDDDEAFTAADGVLQQVERAGVRLTAVQIFGIRREAERLFGEPVIFFVHFFTLSWGAPTTCAVSAFAARPWVTRRST